MLGWCLLFAGFMIYCTAGQLQICDEVVQSCVCSTSSTCDTTDIAVITGSTTAFVGTLTGSEDDGFQDDSIATQCVTSDDVGCIAGNDDAMGITPLNATTPCCCATQFDVCGVCNGNNCTCAAGLNSGECPSVTCTLQQEAQSCCSE
jgi:hypothetical protein